MFKTKDHMLPMKIEGKLYGKAKDIREMIDNSFHTVFTAKKILKGPLRAGKLLEVGENETNITALETGSEKDVRKAL